MDLKLEVKECAGIGATSWPVHVCVPLPEGDYQDTSTFRVTDAAGVSVPAQFEVLYRWWAKDNSIVNVVVRFEATVSAFSTAGTGITEYFLKDDNGVNPAHATPITVTDNATQIVVNTGATTVTINKTAGTITTAKGLLEADVGWMNPNNSAVTLQKSLSRNDITYEVEQSGPIYAVVKLNCKTLYTSATDHTHGWAMRLFFYAGKSYVKVDYQLQNSAKSVRDPVPMYFKYVNLTLTTGEASTAQSIYSTPVTQQSHLDQRGAVSANSAQAMIKNFSHMHPNGLDVDAAGTIKIELWPINGEMLWASRAQDGDTPPNRVTNKYWLGDMMHSYKECLINFGVATSQETTDLNNVFQYHPVVSIPVAQHRLAKNVTGFDGYIPYSVKTTTDDIRVPNYVSRKSGAGDDGFNRLGTSSAVRYKFDWSSFGCDTYRRYKANATGQEPFHALQFMVTEDPQYYFADSALAMSELNMRPIHINGYNNATDQAAMELTHTPYGTRTWRRIGNNGDPRVDQVFPLPDSDYYSSPRNNAHGWFYHVSDNYKYTANPWFRDWFVFMGQFRRTCIRLDDEHPDFSSRGIAHCISNALDAYSFTNDVALLNDINNIYVPAFTARFSALGVNNSDKGKETPFQVAYLTEALSYLKRQTSNPTHIATISGIVQKFGEWIYDYSNFGYYQHQDLMLKNFSVPTSGAMVDPMLWLGKEFDKSEYAEICVEYMSNGINGGRSTEGLGAKISSWSGRDVYGQCYTGYLSGDFTIAGTGTYDITQSLSSDGQPVTVSINTLVGDNVLSSAEAGTSMAVTGTVNAVDGAKITVTLNGISRTTYAFNGGFELIRGNISNSQSKEFAPSQLATLTDGQAYPVTASVVSTGDGVIVNATPVNLLVNLSGGTTATILLNEISGNIIDSTERNQSLIISGTTTAPNGSNISVAFNSVDYPTTATSGTFSVTVPAAAVQSLADNTTYTATATITSSGIADTEDVTTESNQSGGGSEMTAAEIDALIATLELAITEVQLTLVSTGAIATANNTVKDKLTAIAAATS